MSRAKQTEFRTSLIIALAAAAGLIGLNIAQPMPTDAAQVESRPLAYLGPEAVTVMVAGLAADAEARATRALSDAAYFGAYAEGPNGRQGVWAGAHDSDRARTYALAACGAGCAVIAERVPRHRDRVPNGDPFLLQEDLARRLGAGWPFGGNGNVLAIGGAGAWGVGEAYGKTRWKSAVREAVAECHARLAAEAAPEGLEPPHCDYVSLRDQDIEDLRPKPPLYPAAYEVLPTRLVPADMERTALTNPGEMNFILRRQAKSKPRLYTAFATNGANSFGILWSGGWPDAAAALALALCEAERPYGEPACKTVSLRLPTDPVAEGALAVPEETYAAYLDWRKSGGAGAFAISPLGDWGRSYNHDTLEAARQKAADWCHFYARKGTDAFNLRRAFIPVPPCRIVDERLP